jgi:citrate synthase
MADGDDKRGWRTAVTQIAPNTIRIRGRDIGTLIGGASFASVAFLAITGREPSANEARLFEAILVSSVDHGVTPPSAVAARTVASCGVPLSSAVAAGVLAIGRHHGGAVEASMGALYAGVAAAREAGRSVADEAARIVEESRASGQRLSGFGHRVHTRDPRTTRLLALAEELGLAGPHVALAREIAARLTAALGREMPVNVDGAIAALLCELGLPAALGNAPFIVSRVPGLIAHAHEEVTRERPMRTVVPSDAVYDGP